MRSPRTARLPQRRSGEPGRIQGSWGLPSPTATGSFAVYYRGEMDPRPFEELAGRVGVPALEWGQVMSGGAVSTLTGDALTSTLQSRRG